MPNIDLTELLERHGVKTTANRLIVAKALLTEGRPLSLMELEDKIGTIDKSGIFRSLTLFKEHHLVHAIEDAHVHFFCEKCHRTFCLEDIHIPPVTLPAGYSETTANYLIKGICPQCSEDGYGEQ